MRQWIDNVIGGEDGSQAIWAAYEDFNASMYDDMQKRGFDSHEMENVQTAKLIKRMEVWIAEHKLRKSNNEGVVKLRGHDRNSSGISTRAAPIRMEPAERAEKRISTMKAIKDAVEEQLKARKRAAGLSR